MGTGLATVVATTLDVGILPAVPILDTLTGLVCAGVSEVAFSGGGICNDLATVDIGALKVVAAVTVGVCLAGLRPLS